MCHVPFSMYFIAQFHIYGRTIIFVLSYLGGYGYASPTLLRFGTTINKQKRLALVSPPIIILSQLQLHWSLFLSP